MALVWDSLWATEICYASLWSFLFWTQTQTLCFSIMLELSTYFYSVFIQIKWFSLFKSFSVVKQICGGMAKEIIFQPRVSLREPTWACSLKWMWWEKRHLCTLKAQPDSRVVLFRNKLLLWVESVESFIKWLTELYH